MNAWKIVCATLVIFIAGIVTGVVLMRLGERGPRSFLRVDRDRVQRPVLATNLPSPDTAPPRGGPERGNPPGGNRDREFLQLLERQVPLAPEQRERIVQILSDGQERIRRLRQGIEPDIRREMQKTHEQIQALLTPEQREQFQQAMKQRIQRRGDVASPERPFQDFRERRRNVPPRDQPEGMDPRLPPPPGEPDFPQP